jgi:hypothetical protein
VKTNKETIVAKKKSEAKEAKNENTKKPRGPRQQEIPGTERKKIPEVEAAFEDWDEAKSRRMAAKTAEDTKYESALNAMRDAKATTYSFASSDGTTITLTLTDKTKLKVHKAKPAAFDYGEGE